MSLVTNKYTPAEMSPQELTATFAARGHTVEYLLKSLRDQIHSGTLSSFVITGPRGAGKSTVIHMVALRIHEDPELNAAWLPVVFPEEQFNIASLRDLLAYTLETLAKNGLPLAQTWLEKVAAEPNDEQSLQFGMTGLREITKKEKRRLVLFVENLNQLMEDGLDDQMKGTLRRLLMTDPFMMLIGSSVHVFNSLRSYDEAFFNYFAQVPLDRLSVEQVFELLQRRARFDDNKPFLRDFPSQQSKIRAIVHLSGGNPRLVLMLYELLSQQKVTTIVQYLRRLVDELTPLLKDEMENLSKQQQKIIHALMEKGGTAQPTDLVAPTRLPLNAINTQLKRLKDAQIVEVLGGGKGRAAHYTIPDKLFAIWYQMRYLSQNRRRIELFVEVLRIWFEEEERIDTIRKLAEKVENTAPHVLREKAATSEYFAASLKGTKHQQMATELCVIGWAMTDLREAAIAYADLSNDGTGDIVLDESRALSDLGYHFGEIHDHQRAFQAFDEVISKKPSDIRILAHALYSRGVAKGELGDIKGAFDDYSAAIDLKNGPVDIMICGLINRSNIKKQLGDPKGAIADCTAVIELENAPMDEVAWALVNRGVVKRSLGDDDGEIADCTSAIELDGSSNEQIIRALFHRGAAKGRLDDAQGAIADYTTAINMKGGRPDVISKAWFNRGVTKHDLGDIAGAFADYTSLIELEGSPKESLSRAFFNRAAIFYSRNDVDSTLADLIKGIDLAVTVDDHMLNAFVSVFKIHALLFKMSDAEAVLRKLSIILEALPIKQSCETVLRYLNMLASPEMKVAWPHAWRIVAETQQAEVKQALQFLEPVCRLLENEDRTILDALPPEQREFVEKVMTRFTIKQP